MSHHRALHDLEAGLHGGEPADEAVRLHLAECDACHTTWEELRAGSARLTRAIAELPLDAVPSEALRERTRAAILGARPGLAVVPVAPTPQRRWTWLRWGSAGALVGASAMAVVLTLGPLVSGVSAEIFHIEGGATAPQLDARVEVRPADGSASMRLVATNLPASRPGELYELWWVGSDKRHVSCGSFRSDGSPLDLTFTSGADLDATVLIEITVEVDDGDAAPGPHLGQSRPHHVAPDWTPAP